MLKRCFSELIRGTIHFACGGILCILCGHTFGLDESAGSAGINAQIVHEQNITGKGIHIALISSGNVLATHEAFLLSGGGGSVTNYDFSDKGLLPNSHDTQVAGIIVSQGSAQHPDCLGIAPDSRIHSARISDGALSATVLDRALEQLIANQGCKIVVTGVQLASSSSTPNGSSTWAKMYDFYAEEYDVIFANASGNSETVVTVFGDGYNGLTTGGLALDAQGEYRIVGSISNPGPTSDGRQKPDITAPAHELMVPNASSTTAWSNAGTSAGQTSFAAPHTAGVAALLLERAGQTTTPYDNKSLTIKAIMINTANPNLFDKSRNWTNPGQTVWHPHRGFGRLDAGRALALLNAGRIRAGTTPLTIQAGWSFEKLSYYDQDTYRIKADKKQRMVLTLTWHRKLIRYSATAYAEEVPRFNLLLQVKAPDGQILFTESLLKDNVRKADLLLPADGIYEILIQNQSYQKNREYALAIELIDPLEGDLNDDYQVDVLDIPVFSERWLGGQAGPYYSSAEITTYEDFALLSTNWLSYDPYYAWY